MFCPSLDIALILAIDQSWHSVYGILSVYPVILFSFCEKSFPHTAVKVFLLSNSNLVLVRVKLSAYTVGYIIS